MFSLNVVAWEALMQKRSTSSFRMLRMLRKTIPLFLRNFYHLPQTRIFSKSMIFWLTIHLTIAKHQFCMANHVRSYILDDKPTLILWCFWSFVNTESCLKHFRHHVFMLLVVAWEALMYSKTYPLVRSNSNGVQI